MGPLLELGPSHEPVGLTALVIGCVLLAFAFARRQALRSVLLRGSSVEFVGACAALAALLSAGYIAYFLRGGPRIIDATSYFLEARTLAAGHFSMPALEPTAAWRGRFSLLGPQGLAVIFPPGYPLVLALGFVLGAPLAVGPLLAALLVGVTYVAGKELRLGEEAARLAALLSALCATLRYHTADTMSHGLSALLLTACLAAVARPNLTRAALAGLCAGWLVATRPVSGGIAALLVLALLARRDLGAQRPRFLATAAFALVPGVWLLASYQQAATGSLLQSTQLAYYAVADGPPGCFRWGFGKNVGCRFEHGDFVKKHLESGFGPLAALYVTGERLLWHLFDVSNLAPLSLLVPWVAWRARAQRGVRWLTLAAGLTILGYFPFYYPGSYPGGGARLLADALPLEQLLLAVALVRLELSAFTPALALLGFALSTVHAHLALRDREGGHPLFEPSALKAQRVRSGLVWVTTDHAFALGHDPVAHDPRRSVVVARSHGDAHDLALWEGLGRPPSSTYDYSVDTGRVSITPFRPPGGTWRWELEAEWPPLAVSSGWVHPDFRPCLSQGQGLHLRAAPTASIEVELGAPRPGSYSVFVGWLADPGDLLVVTLGKRRFELMHHDAGCESPELGVLELDRVQKLGLTSAKDVFVDYVELSPAPSK